MKKCVRPFSISKKIKELYDVSFVWCLDNNSLEKPDLIPTFIQQLLPDDWQDVHF